MANNLMAPPIRTGLINNPDGTPLTQAGPSDGSGSSSGTPLQTEKSWYYYWRDLGRRLNDGTDKLAKLVTYGGHADRPDPANMPDGALYVETDRGVIYANEGGVWQYVAGTMWDTLSPDNRPTDLGAHDAGFDFRTTDQPAREFIWSQTEWIEATPVRYGTHAAAAGRRRCGRHRSTVMGRNRPRRNLSTPERNDLAIPRRHDVGNPRPRSKAHRSRHARCRV